MSDRSSPPEPNPIHIKVWAEDDGWWFTSQYDPFDHGPFVGNASTAFDIAQMMYYDGGDEEGWKERWSGVPNRPTIFPFEQ